MPSKLLNNWFMINHELLRRREYIGFYKEIPREKCGPFNLMKIGWTATIVRVRWAMIPGRGPMFAIFIARPILIGPSWCIHASPHDEFQARFNLDHWISLTRSMIGNCTRALMKIRWTPSTCNWHIFNIAIVSDAPHNATSLGIKNI